uniref:Matrilin 4 n=1 Tax=Oryzias latipes TaxID=8090 RepID=A0A3B3H6V0_ORYLA
MRPLRASRVFVLLGLVVLTAARPRAGPDQKCKPGPLDLIFLIDSSRSVRPHEFETMRKFMIDILNSLEIGPDSTRVGVVQYSSQVRSEFSLKTHGDLESVVAGIRQIVPLAQGTMTGLAIRYMMNEAFTAEQGDRPKVPNVAVIVTDGRPQDRVAEVAAEARERGIEIFAVGVARADMTSLRAMASLPFEDHVFLEESFDLIHQFGLQFQDAFCGLDLCKEMDHGCEHVCENSPGSFHCLCSEGYTLNEDGKTCTAIDLCAEGKHDCEQVCISSPGNFSCDCREGYRLQDDGRTCSMVEFCSFGNDSCDHHCVNMLNGFYCTCKEGHRLQADGKTCQAIDLCAEGKHDCEQVCISAPGVFTCDCRKGFRLNHDKKTCTNMEMCSSVQHGCEHQCVNTPGSYYCVCPEGQLLQDDGKSCGACTSANIDLVLLIDGSKSVRPQNFELVKKFVNQVVDSLDVSAHGTRVGLVQYSSRVRTEFPLNMYHTAEDIKAAVMKVEYMEKGTMTGLALKHMLENSFSEAEGARPAARSVPRVGLVFTDGRSQDDISEYAKKAKEAGITMYAVGVGKAVEDELREIASEPVEKHFYYTTDFNAISTIADNLKLNVCPEESQGEVEVKDPCACENLVEFQQNTGSSLEQLTQKLAAMNTRLVELENQLLSRK